MTDKIIKVFCHDCKWLSCWSSWLCYHPSNWIADYSKKRGHLDMPTFDRNKNMDCSLYERSLWMKIRTLLSFKEQ